MRRYRLDDCDAETSRLEFWESTDSTHLMSPEESNSDSINEERRKTRTDGPKEETNGDSINDERPKADGLEVDEMKSIMKELKKEYGKEATKRMLKTALESEDW
uniref:Uncharacterized protein n=1 Tax=Grammatophora oceanica TaxID=210454 RepID=A0A7S1V4B4_9STRA|mmetsp:Transcript_35068/g.52140  ORF Transcript_35068/g.52140 Transcript_35068/m.52140 type:complete len:104 (+) Transcript_35068:2-313(+)